MKRSHWFPLKGQDWVPLLRTFDGFSWNFSRQGSLDFLQPGHYPSPAPAVFNFVADSHCSREPIRLARLTFIAWTTRLGLFHLHGFNAVSSTWNTLLTHLYSSRIIIWQPRYHCLFHWTFPNCPVRTASSSPLPHMASDSITTCISFYHVPFLLI